MKIFPYLDKRLIFFLEEASKEEVLHYLVHATVTSKKLPHEARFLDAIMEREKLVSTGIGMGIAIPHAKLPVYDDFFIAVGIIQQGIDWEALDGAPVRLVFLIGGPDDKQTEYLQILSTITVTLRDPKLRKEILTAETPQEVLQHFENS